jgi:hypothetical protein
VKKAGIQMPEKVDLQLPDRPASLPQHPGAGTMLPQGKDVEELAIKGAAEQRPVANAFQGTQKAIWDRPIRRPDNLAGTRSCHEGMSDPRLGIETGGWSLVAQTLRNDFRTQPVQHRHGCKDSLSSQSRCTQDEGQKTRNRSIQLNNGIEGADTTVGVVVEDLACAQWSQRWPLHPFQVQKGSHEIEIRLVLFRSADIPVLVEPI